MTALPPLFIANWKMNMLEEEANRFAQIFLEKHSAKENSQADVGFAPPITALKATVSNFDSRPGILVGAQNIHWLETGAHTGEISAPMLSEQGADFAIIGHSERRQFYGESNEGVAMRSAAAIKHGIKAIVCVGETKDDFQSGKSLEVVKQQLYGSLGELSADDTKNLVVAYEPVWAIGTGLAATPELASNIHTSIRAELIKLFGEEKGSLIPLLYGGSTKPDNIAALMGCTEINGALVGGASLLPETFASLIEIGRKANA